MLPFFGSLEKWVEKLYDQTGVRFHGAVLLVAGLVALLLGIALYPEALTTAFQMTFFLSPLWVSVLLAWAAWHEWVVWRRSAFIASQEYALLEIKPPRSLDKTPLAMEAVLSGLHITTGETNWYSKYIKGGVRPYWSFEIASLEGKLHFFIWTRAQFRRMVEAQIYAQYPGAQLTEVQDYTRLITAHPEEWRIWGCDFKHTKPDPYPLKTYVEYNLDKPQKEPEQVDPLSNLLEFMGSMKKGEYMWLQIMVQASKGGKYGRKKNAAGDQYTWKDEAEKIVKEIRVKTRETYIDQTTGEERPGFPNPTKGQSETMAAIERNVSKPAFDVGVRVVYLTSGPFNLPVVYGIINMFKQFSSEGWNGLKATRWLMGFSDYPWEIFVERRRQLYRKRLVEAFRRRTYFHDPYKTEPMIMSTEEVATLYHVPSAAVAAPSLSRVSSATGAAPPNLPT